MATAELKPAAAASQDGSDFEGSDCARAVATTRRPLVQNRLSEISEI